MRSRGYRKKTLNISDSFSRHEQLLIVRTIEDNYKRPSNRSSEKPRLDWDFLSELIGFSIRKSKVVIKEFPDIITVGIIKAKI